MRWAGALVAVAACHPLPPPPMVALHDDTAPAPRGATAALVVVGIAGELLGGDGLGAALRVERQVSDRVAVGGELTGGRGDDGERGRLTLVAARGFAQVAPADHDWVGATVSAGVGVLSSGLVSVAGFGGVAVSYPNGYAAPYLQLGLAPVWVVRRGAGFGMVRSHGCLACDDHGPAPAPDGPDAPRSDVFWTVDVGLVGLLGDTGNRVSLDLGLAAAIRASDGVLALSLGDRQELDR